MNPNRILLYAQIGDQVLKIGLATYEAIARLRRADGVEVDNAQLDRLAAICRERADISDREAARG